MTTTATGEGRASALDTAFSHVLWAALNYARVESILNRTAELVLVSNGEASRKLLGDALLASMRSVHDLTDAAIAYARATRDVFQSPEDRDRKCRCGARLGDHDAAQPYGHTDTKCFGFTPRLELVKGEQS